MVHAINLQDNVEHLPCAAYTLQLSINHAFQKSSIYIKRIKCLVYFFTTFFKQSKYLNDAQKEYQRQTQTSLLEISNNSDDNYSENNNITNISSNISDNPKEQILRNIANVKIRQNSKYHFWNHLLKLHKAIEWLATTLPLSNNFDNHVNGKKLKKQLLLPYEWDLLKQIIDLLKSFDDATIYFNETSYVTLSIIYSLIQALKYDYACDYYNLIEEQGKF